MLTEQHSKEGAPFLGTALAENKQCIEAEVVCHFHLTCVSMSGFDFQMGLLLLITALYSKDVVVTG